MDRIAYIDRIKKRISTLIRSMDRGTLLVVFVVSLSILYYIDPLKGVEIGRWDRTFCPATIAGVSIDKRIRNLYLLFLVVFPCVSIAVATVYMTIIRRRGSYVQFYNLFSIVSLFAVAASYISRYASDTLVINGNAFLQTVLALHIVLTAAAILDVEAVFDRRDLVMLSVAYMIAVVSADILLGRGILVSLSLTSILFIAYVGIVGRMSLGKKIFRASKDMIYILMWSPAILRLILEGLYLLNEKGYQIGYYHTGIAGAAAVLILFAALSTYILRKRERDRSVMGYVGVIVSLSALSSFAYRYQYVWGYSHHANLYETGNAAVAADTILHGELPIIDYFSAHALDDVWTRILYSVIHSDLKGIFADPYRGLASLFASLLLFYIIKALFDQDVAVLTVCLFPFTVSGVKSVSLCFIPVVLFLYIIKIPGIRTYLLFWIGTLVGAFMRYDEGISLGIACMMAHTLLLLVQKRWGDICRFIACGISVGAVVSISYLIYCLATGLPPFSRLREWLSVSVGSSSTWATVSFGEPSSFAFLCAYLIAPMCAVMVMVLTIVRYLKSRRYPMLAAITVVFALAELFYIGRTVIYHNLAVCSGKTGVLFNFLHWTVSLYVLYVCSLKGDAFERRLFVWLGAFGLTVIMEGAVVTGNLPTSSAILYAKAAGASAQWHLKDDDTSIWGQERIVFDEATTAYVGQFQKVFDTLLDEDETFIDFANLTSLYALTGRERPCYVGQSPSLLTDLYSQVCFLDGLSAYRVPLAVLGTADDPYIQVMDGVVHNVRYYKIAEYIYRRYRPLLLFGDIAIWCEKGRYDASVSKLKATGLLEQGYTLADAGYDRAVVLTDEAGGVRYSFSRYHSCNLRMIPYIWADRDRYDAIENRVIVRPKKVSENVYTFEGSQSITRDKGNFWRFACENPSEEDIVITVTFQDKGEEGIVYRYDLTAVPGKEDYLIRVSQDHFWHAFDIDTVTYSSERDFLITDVEILEGD